MSGRTYFDLCNEILQELFYEQFQTFDELEATVEGRKVMIELNSANNFICNNEQRPWKFRQVDIHIPLVEGMRDYPMPDGFLNYIKYTDTPLELQYIEDHHTLPLAYGMPTGYYVDNNRLKVYPVPDKTNNNRLLKGEVYTYDFARDKYGVLKCQMECPDDTSIIPAHHRDILKWKVCEDWRASAGDSKAAYYNQKFKRAYRALLSDQRLAEDYPNRLDVMPRRNSFTSEIMRAFCNPWIGRGYKR